MEDDPSDGYGGGDDAYPILNEELLDSPLVSLLVSLIDTTCRYHPPLKGGRNSKPLKTNNKCGQPKPPDIRLAGPVLSVKCIL